MPAYAPPRRNATHSPSALAIVLGLHAAGLAALLLYKPALVAFVPSDPPDITFIDPAPPPEPVPPPPAPPQSVPAPNPPQFAEPIVPLPVPGPAIDAELLTTPAPPTELAGVDAGVLEVELLPARVPPRLVTPGDKLKPPYPSSMRRAEKEATLRLRLAVDRVGRVTSVTPLNDVEPAFLAAAERHILKHWRYEPARLGDDAIAADVTVSLAFTLED